MKTNTSAYNMVITVLSAIALAQPLRGSDDPKLVNAWAIQLPAEKPGASPTSAFLVFDRQDDKSTGKIFLRDPTSNKTETIKIPHVVTDGNTLSFTVERKTQDEKWVQLYSAEIVEGVIKGTLKETTPAKSGTRKTEWSGVHCFVFDKDPFKLPKDPYPVPTVPPTKPPKPEPTTTPGSNPDAGLTPKT